MNTSQYISRVVDLLDPALNTFHTLSIDDCWELVRVG